MNKFITIALTAICMACALQANADNKKDNIYAFGFSASFNDSTVYFTEIQLMEGTWVDSKTGFLYSRDNCSYQLREALKTLGLRNPTCVTVYAKTRKDVEKKYFAMKKRYTANGRYNVKYLTAHDFSFEPIEPDDSEKVSAYTKKAKKEKKEKN